MTVAPRELLPVRSPLVALTGADSTAPCRRVRSRMRQQLHVQNWVSEAVESLNMLYGGGQARESHSLSAGQIAGLAHVQEVIAGAGPPPCSAAAAHAELCSHSPGYLQSPEPQAVYQRDRVSLPLPAAHCDPSQVLVGTELDQWVHWEKRLLRTDPSSAPEIRPHNDQSLIRDRTGYAQFIWDLRERGLVDIGPRKQHTVGVFFVWKSDRQRLRLILDTRRVNGRFEDPAYTQLPTAAAWSGLRSSPGALRTRDPVEGAEPERSSESARSKPHDSL